jgi:hypothetical protein
MSIATKRGDAGQTGLAGGIRISKADLRVEAYGSVDELNTSSVSPEASAPTLKSQAGPRPSNAPSSAWALRSQPLPKAKKRRP